MGLAKLLAETFLPNPYNHTRVIFKDGNNHHCVLDNIQWVSNREFVRHNLFPGKSLEKKSKPLKPKPPLAPVLPPDSTAAEIPGWPGYYINPQGQVYYNGRLKKLICKPGLSVKMQVYYEYTRRELGVATLLAKTFLPNPGNYTRVVYKDGNKHNCVLDNIKWVSDREFVRNNLFPGKSMDIKSMPRKPKPSFAVPAFPHDSTAVEIPGFTGYYITPQGDYYHFGRQINVHGYAGNKSLCITLKNNGRAKSFGLAKLMATLFIPNPCAHTRIIFKDRNNRNCTLANIAWASDKEYNGYIQSFKPSLGPGASIEEIDSSAQPIPGYKDHWITPDGKVYAGNRCLNILEGKGRRAHRVRIRNSEGKLMSLTVAKLVALTFIPNPENHPKVIFKDHDLLNCTVDNLQWVSRSNWNRFVSGSTENADLLGPPKPKKEKPYVWIDPERVELPDFPGYYVTQQGVIYHGDKILKAICRRGNAPVVKLRIPGTAAGIYRFCGLATLVAENFIPNPRHYKRIIFKDRNNQNCTATNIAWVDQETYTYYCTAHKGGKKLVIDREEAIRQCTDQYLKMYYKTLDEYWLHECWNEVEKEIYVYDWEEFRSDCYIYFLDRAKRFSILKKPAGMLAMHIKGLREKLRKEISPDMPFSRLVATDESLRHTRDYY